MHNFSHLLIREFKLFWSNKLFVFAFLVMPLLLCLILGYVYRKGHLTELPIVVVDLDQSPSSARLIDMLDESANLHIVHVTYELVDLNHLMLHNEATAVVMIPYRFEANLISQKRPEINCYLNMFFTMTSSVVGGAVGQCTGAMNTSMLISSLEAKGVPSSLATKQFEAVKHNVFYQYNPAGNYLYFLWPGLIFSVLHQLLLLALALSFAREFEMGTFNKTGLLYYTRSPLLLIAAKFVPYLIMGLFHIGVYFILSDYFRIPRPAHPMVLFVSQVLLIAGASLLAMMYSILISMPLKASQMLMSIASPAFTISGFVWPQVPPFLEGFSKIIPLVPYLKVTRCVLIQRGDWPDVSGSLQHQTVLILVYLCITAGVLYVKIQKAVGLEKDDSGLVVTTK
ncbi:MAG: type transporter [Sphingobacterium sp.]|jgi:ABC-2 type transport system permease protein|nr:type transporter [Sphingobacterium sp.]